MADADPDDPCGPKRRARMRSPAGAIGVIAPALTLVATQHSTLSGPTKGALLAIIGGTLMLDSRAWKRAHVRAGQKRESRVRVRKSKGPISLPS